MEGRAQQTLQAQCAIVSATCTSNHLRQASRALTQFYAKMIRSSGLEPTQFTLLAGCAVAGRAPITLLADALVMDRTTLTRNLKLLEKQGLVTTLQGADRRVRMVELSPKGQRALTRALPLWKKAQAQIARELGQARLDHLLKDLSAVVAVSRSQ